MAPATILRVRYFWVPSAYGKQRNLTAKDVPGNRYAVRFPGERSSRYGHLGKSVVIGTSSFWKIVEAVSSVRPVLISLRLPRRNQYVPKSVAILSNTRVVEMKGLEPSTFGLQSRCSPIELHPRIWGLFHPQKILYLCNNTGRNIFKEPVEKRHNNYHGKKYICHCYDFIIFYRNRRYRQI